MILNHKRCISCHANELTPFKEVTFSLYFGLLDYFRSKLVGSSTCFLLDTVPYRLADIIRKAPTDTCGKKIMQETLFCK